MKGRAARWASAFAAAALCLAQEPSVTFRAESRLVEVYASVQDPRGRYVDNLTDRDFRVLDNGAAQSIVSFENSATELSCAVLLDTTGSMANALPKVKHAVYQLIDEFRDGDSVAVYAFNNGVERLLDFTADKPAAKRAVSLTRAEGSTALFDAISRVSAEISRRKGKKSIVVFTDGADNASVLNARRAIDRAKKLGIPVYTAAEGDALKTPSLLDLLKELAKGTGGKAYSVKSLANAAAIFQDISEELRHTYWLAYQAPPANDSGWRSIQVLVAGASGAKVRAKEGYLPN